MKVYDIIQTVEQGARTSLPPGERWVDSRDSHQSAVEVVRLWNSKACSGVSYRVMEIDESDPERLLP